MAPFPPLRAEDYQDSDDAARLAAEAADGPVADQVSDAFDRWRKSIEIAALIALLRSGITVTIWDVLRIEQVSVLLQPAANRLTELYDDVAEDVELPSDFGEPGVYDPLEAAVLEEQQAAATGISDAVVSNAKVVVEQILAGAGATAAPAEEVARDIVSTLGLPPRAAKAVSNFRALLERGDKAALQRVLRDRRFDATVQRLIDQGEFASQNDIDKIDRMVERYAERYRAHQADVIARYRTMEAANAGRRAAWRQFGERKGLSDDAIRKFWQTAADERVCPICRPIPLLNIEGVPLDEPYVTTDGESDGPPEHGECRCTERFAVDPGASQQSRAVPFGEVRIVQ